MHQNFIAPAQHHRPIGRESPPAGRSPLGTFVFVALLVVPLFAFEYPVATLALLVGLVAFVVLARSISRAVRRCDGRVRTLALPGLGTVEYRITKG